MKSFKFKNRIVCQYLCLKTKKVRSITFGWDARNAGKANLENLKKFRTGLNDSITDTDGANSHLRDSQSVYSNCRIETNVPYGVKPVVIAEFKPETFEII